jgi:predicted MFS family arabinose efflux permease
MTETFSAGRRRAVFAAAVSGYILSQFYRSFLTVIVDELTRDLAIGPREFGALGAVWFLVFAVMQIPVGIWLDRFGPRRTIVGMMGAAVIGAVLFAEARSFPVALIAMGLIGFGCAPILMGALYFFARTETPAQFASLGSIFLGVGLLGGLFAATPLALLVQAMGWRAALHAIAVVTLLSLALIAVVLRDPPRAQVEAEGSVLGGFLTLLRVPGMVPFLLMSIVITAEVWTERSLWVGPFFGEVYGLDALMRGHVILAMGVAMTVSALAAGPIASALNAPKAVTMVGTSVVAAGFFALALWPGMPLLSAVVIMLMIGLFGATYVVMIAHARSLMPTALIGRGITLINFLSIGGTGVLQLVSGMAVERAKGAGLPPAEVYASMHLMFGVLMFAGVVVYVFAPSGRGK